MKTSSAGAPVKRSRAMNCLLMNQFATPGLGSLMGRRILAGTIQLSMMVLGCVLYVGYFMGLIINAYREGMSEPEQAPLFPHMGLWGTILCVLAWSLSWITSLSLLREARQNPETPAPTGPPPRPQPPLLK